MTILKKLMIVTALLAGGSSLAMAQQYGGPNGSQPLVTAPSGMPAYGPAAPGPGHVISGTAQHGPTGYGGPNGSEPLVTAPSGMPAYGATVPATQR
jgi:hypothetical protein